MEAGGRKLERAVRGLAECDRQLGEPRRELDPPYRDLTESDRTKEEGGAELESSDRPCRNRHHGARQTGDPFREIFGKCPEKWTLGVTAWTLRDGGGRWPGGSGRRPQQDDKGLRHRARPHDSGLRTSRP